MGRGRGETSTGRKAKVSRGQKSFSCHHRPMRFAYAHTHTRTKIELIDKSGSRHKFLSDVLKLSDVSDRAGNST